MGFAALNPSYGLRRSQLSQPLPVGPLEAESIFVHASSATRVARGSAHTLSGVHVLGAVLFALRERLLIRELLLGENVGCACEGKHQQACQYRHAKRS